MDGPILLFPSAANTDPYFRNTGLVARNIDANIVNPTALGAAGVIAKEAISPRLGEELKELMSDANELRSSVCPP